MSRQSDLAALGTTGLWTGDIHLTAYWNDRVITDAERFWIYSIARGG